MTTVQLFETTLATREQGYSLRYMVIPARSVLDSSVLTNRSDLAGILGVSVLDTLPSPSFLPHALVSILNQLDAQAASGYFKEVLAAPQRDAMAKVDQDLVAFAEQAAFAKLVPFESSPLDLQSVASVLAAPSTVGIGALVGFVVAGGAVPLLLITVPAGIILVGAAAGLAEALQQGLRGKVLKLMGVRAAESTATQRPEGPDEKTIQSIISDVASIVKMAGHSVDEGRIIYLVQKELSRQGWKLDEQTVRRLVYEELNRQERISDKVHAENLAWLRKFVKDELRKKGLD